MQEYKECNYYWTRLQIKNCDHSNGGPITKILPRVLAESNIELEHPTTEAVSQ